MMHGPEKSDSPIVATKPTNKVARAAAEPVERRGETKENAEKLRMRRTQCRESVSQQLDRVRQAVKRGEGRFTALLHHVSEDLLLLSFFWLKRKAAVGVDGVSWADYEEHLEARLADLHKRIHSNAYQAQPSKRQYIPKPDGQQRPLGIAALEDKIVQRALVAVLNAIYEHDFLGFSYGFRPGVGDHVEPRFFGTWARGGLSPGRIAVLRKRQTQTFGEALHGAGLVVGDGEASVVIPGRAL